MYLTNQQLITQRKDGWGDLSVFSDHLWVIYSLVKKYGSSSVKGGLFDSIKTANADVAEVITLLSSIGKLNQKKLGSLVSELWWGSSEGYIVKSNNPESVEGKIEPSADKLESSKIEVKISGDGKIYKRSLEGDLGKMLA